MRISVFLFLFCLNHLSIILSLYHKSKLAYCYYLSLPKFRLSVLYKILMFSRGATCPGARKFLWMPIEELYIIQDRFFRFLRLDSLPNTRYILALMLTALIIQCDDSLTLGASSDRYSFSFIPSLPCIEHPPGLSGLAINNFPCFKKVKYLHDVFENPNNSMYAFESLGLLRCSTLPSLMPCIIKLTGIVV